MKYVLLTILVFLAMLFLFDAQGANASRPSEGGNSSPCAFHGQIYALWPGGPLYICIWTGWKYEVYPY